MARFGQSLRSIRIRQQAAQCPSKRFRVPRETGRDLYVEPQRVQLTLDEPIKAANLYQPNRSASQIETYTEPKRITLDVPDEILVIELVPSD